MSETSNSVASAGQTSTPNVERERTPRRKALLIGINYTGQRGQLLGCIDSVVNLSLFINRNYGFGRDDIVILTDDQQNPMSQPIKANIIRAMSWLAKDAQASDCLFFYFCGHGGQAVSTDANEDDDGYDECIYPVDFRSTGHILDEDMHHLMVRPLPAGVRLTAIFDSPHINSALDLPYIYSHLGPVKQPNLSKHGAQGLASIVSAYATGEVSGLSAIATGLFKRKGSSKKIEASTRASPADVIVLSSSKGSQTKQDTATANLAIGVIAQAFIKAIKKNPQTSYAGLLANIRAEVPETSRQSIQLSCCHPLDLELLFVL